MTTNSKKVDPGWNDPPMLNYSSANPPPKSRIGNRRVAFPLGTSSTNCLSDALLPDNLPSISTDNTNSDMDRITFSNFDLLVRLMPSDDVVPKLELMKTMWKTGQLSQIMKNEIYELSNSLVNGELENANKLHLKLLMNHSGQCGSWLSLIQFFINDLSKKMKS